MTKRKKAIAAISTTMLFWGFSFISTKIALDFFPPLTLAALRFALALVLLFFLVKRYAPKEKIRKEDVFLLAGAGLTGVTSYFSFENRGVSLIPASEASIITAAIPILTMIAVGIEEKIVSLRNKKPEKKEPGGGARRRHILYKVILPGAGALISLTGVALVAGVSLVFSGEVTGYLFMLGACFSWICYCLLTRPLFERHSRIFIVFWQTLVGFLGFLPFAVSEASWKMPDLYVWGHILFLGICCSAMGYWFYAQALQVLGAGTASLFLNFVPVISVVGGFFVLGERLRPLQLLGAVLVLAGVYLAMLGNGRESRPAARELPEETAGKKM